MGRFDTGWVAATSAANGTQNPWGSGSNACQSWSAANGTYAVRSFGNGNAQQGFHRFAFSGLAAAIPTSAVITRIRVRLLGFIAGYNKSLPGSPVLLVTPALSDSTDNSDTTPVYLGYNRHADFTDDRTLSVVEYAEAQMQTGEVWPTATNLRASTFRVVLRFYRGQHFLAGTKTAHVDSLEIRVEGVTSTSNSTNASASGTMFFPGKAKPTGRPERFRMQHENPIGGRMMHCSARNPSKQYALVFGGTNNPPNPFAFGGDGPWAANRIDKYDITTNSWADITPEGCVGSLFPAWGWTKPDQQNRDRYVAFGGVPHFNMAPHNRTFVYTYETGQWVERFPNPSPPARWGCGSATLPDGRFMIYGGTIKPYVEGAVIGNVLNDTWIYDPDAGPQGTWTEVNYGPAPLARCNMSMATAMDGRPVMCSGQERQGTFDFIRDVWVFDISLAVPKWQKMWEADPYDPMAGVAASSFCPLDETHMLQFNGLSVVSAHMQEVRILDLENWAKPWRQLTPPWAGRDFNTCFQVASGKVLLHGGWGNTDEFDDELASWWYEQGDPSQGIIPELQPAQVDVFAQDLSPYIPPQPAQVGVHAARLTVPSAWLDDLIVEVTVDRPTGSDRLILGHTTQSRLGRHRLGADAWLPLKVISMHIYRGRVATHSQSWEASTCEIELADLERKFDPANQLSVHAPRIRPGLLFRVKAVHAGKTYVLWTGFVERWEWTWDPNSPNVTKVTVNGTDLISQLSAIDIPSLLDHEPLVGNGETADERLHRICDIAKVGDSRRVFDSSRITVAGTRWGTNAADAIAITARSEAGQLYVDTDGRLVLRNRRWNLLPRSQTAQSSFGDNRISELPVGELRPVLDWQTIYNDVEVVWQHVNTSLNAQTEIWSQTIEQRQARAQNDASIRKYGRRQLRIATILDSERRAAGLAQAMLRLFSQPEVRVREILLKPRHPAKPGNLWRHILRRELGDRVKVTIRPEQGQGPVVFDAIIDGIEHSYKAASKDWTTRLRIWTSKRLPDNPFTLGESLLGHNDRVYY